jgi:hypothetical protein
MTTAPHMRLALCETNGLACCNTYAEQNVSNVRDDIKWLYDRNVTFQTATFISFMFHGVYALHTFYVTPIR